MRMLLLLAGLLLPLAAASQEIYRWVDKNGVVHYSDQPDSPDAELIDVIEPNEYAAEGAAAAPAADYAEDQEPAEAQYGSLSITQPPAEEVFFGADAVVGVTASLDGELQSGHSLVFYVNGSRRPAEGLGIELSGLPRGSYELRAAVVDESGQTVITSPRTTFHVRQPSINSPQSPQAPRPAPRPRPQQPRPANTPGG
jgi:Domain of unknown function (DUF4124)